MSKYIDLVPCKNGMLFIAPAFSHIKKGTDIVVAKGVFRTSADALTCVEGGEEYQFVKDAFGFVGELQKVGEIIEHVPVRWGDDNEE